MLPLNIDVRRNLNKKKEKLIYWISILICYIQQVNLWTHPENAAPDFNWDSFVGPNSGLSGTGLGWDDPIPSDRASRASDIQKNIVSLILLSFRSRVRNTSLRLLTSHTLSRQLCWGESMWNERRWSAHSRPFLGLEGCRSCLGLSVFFIQSNADSAADLAHVSNQVRVKASKDTTSTPIPN